MIQSFGFPLPAVFAGLLIFIFLCIKFLKTENTGPALIVFGAVLNLIDRIPDGKATDFIHLGIAIVNLADLAIYTGIIYVAKSLFSRGFGTSG